MKDYITILKEAIEEPREFVVKCKYIPKKGWIVNAEIEDSLIISRDAVESCIEESLTKEMPDGIDVYDDTFSQLIRATE